MDSYADGMSGCPSSEGGNGSYQITWNDTVLAELLSSNADFGSEYKQQFCLPKSGVNKMTLDLIKVYPNPADKHIVVSSQKENPINEIVISDLSGKICLKKSGLQSDGIEINISEFASGYYTLTIETLIGTIVKKLLIN
jgi:hypothetical protein